MKQVMQVVMLKSTNGVIWKDSNDRLSLNMLNKEDYPLAFKEVKESETINHLYILSDRVCEQGCIALDPYTNTIGICANSWNEDNKVVEASTDLTLNLPIIRKNFVESYVRANGSIKEVNVEVEELYALDCNIPEYRVKTRTEDNSIIITPTQLYSLDFLEWLLNPQSDYIKHLETLYQMYKQGNVVANGDEGIRVINTHLYEKIN